MEKEILKELKKLNKKLDLLIDALKVNRDADCEGESVGFYLQRIFSLLNNWIIRGSGYRGW